jgi:predicted flavoprotein YhiN
LAEIVWERVAKGAAASSRPQTGRKTVGKAAVARSGDTSPKAAELTAEARKILAAALSGLSLNVCGTEGFAKAMVTRGGVTLEAVDRARCKARCWRGCSFAGEVLDLDGPCGGFNLQWAFASGYLAGVCMAKIAESVK